MFDPSQKQLDALANMERFAGIRSNRLCFKDRQEFDAYWQRVSSRCDRNADSRHCPTKQAPRQGQQDRQRHYHDRQTLLDYGRWYCQRYQPAVGKLRQKLQGKCGLAELAEEVCAELAATMDDRGLIDDHIERLRRQGRTRADIRAKLRRRQFPAALIDERLRASETEDGGHWDPDVLTRQVERLHGRGLSRLAIRQKLCERPDDGPLIDEALAAVCGDDGDDQTIRDQIEGLRDRKGLDDQAILRRLASRGFRYADIRRLL